MESLIDDQLCNLHHFGRQNDKYKDQKANQKDGANFFKDIFEKNSFQMRGIPTFSGPQVSNSRNLFNLFSTVWQFLYELMGIDCFNCLFHSLFPRLYCLAKARKR